ncbi:MAG: His-Xaa-Ser system radical SAM maturase HxsC [Bacilli bacterium]
MRFINYNGEYKIVSLALDERAKKELIENKLSFLYVNLPSNALELYPDGLVLSTDKEDVELIKKFNNFDVFELRENGLLIRKYDDSSVENVFYITGKCNSNCMMCPSPEFSRKKAPPANLNELLMLARHIPSDTPHLTITGGEPFMMGESIFIFLNYLKEKFTKTDFLILTNGRIFAVEEYVKDFCSTAPLNTLVAIPLHGSNAQIHDSITRSKDSFVQTVIGLENLIRVGVSIEIRLVVSKINMHDFDNMAKLIIERFKRVEYVSIIAMEMTGTARDNLDQVWLTYKQAFTSVKSSVESLIDNGIDVKLYNFPLCTVEKSFWPLCEKSISPNKVRFIESCNKCKYKGACSGVFAGTIMLERDELKPLL